ncbi:hypothetical protein [Microbispora triticiradicis]|uniref:hypothetical protein n=1 Tax=Microbispora triticiradicis TaxID=2200763 RepID=UPI001AD765C0|nr:hypothetical protein [Microbispora triticiradicis]MBO4272384.1 hypothetical protein [Microbispora triticiradicis]
MAFDAQFFAQFAANYTNPLDLTTVSSPVSFSQQINFAQGSGAGQADMMWSDTRTVAASSTDAIDLAGSLTGPFGTTATFARIKGVIVRAAAGNTNNVNVVTPSSNGTPLFLAASDGIAVKPGGLFVWIDPSAGGVAVTAGTGDLLNLVNSGGGTSVTYDIYIIGASS